MEQAAETVTIIIIQIQMALTTNDGTLRCLFELWWEYASWRWIAWLSSGAKNSWISCGCNAAKEWILLIIFCSLCNIVDHYPWSWSREWRCTNSNEFVVFSVIVQVYTFLHITYISFLIMYTCTPVTLASAAESLWQLYGEKKKYAIEHPPIGTSMEDRWILISFLLFPKVTLKIIAQ